MFGLSLYNLEYVLFFFIKKNLINLYFVLIFMYSFLMVSKIFFWVKILNFVHHFKVNHFFHWINSFIDYFVGLFSLLFVKILKKLIIFLDYQNHTLIRGLIF